jgi:hypothetical protein
MCGIAGWIGEASDPEEMSHGLEVLTAKGSI